MTKASLLITGLFCLLLASGEDDGIIPDFIKTSTGLCFIFYSIYLMLKNDK